MLTDLEPEPTTAAASNAEKERVRALAEQWMPLVTYCLRKFPWARESLGDKEAMAWGFLALCRAANKFDPKRARFNTFAVWAVKREWQNQIRRLDSEQKRKKDRRGKRSIYAHDGGGIGGDEMELVRRALGQLEPRLAEVLRLCVLDGMTGQAAGKVLGVCKERVRQLRDKALRQMRQLLAWDEYGVRVRDEDD